MNEIRDGHYTLGIVYLNAEGYTEAITHFKQSVELDAAFIDGYHALALAYFGEHRLQDAKDAALEALKIDATHPPTLSFLQAMDPGASTPQVSVAPREPPDVIAPQTEKEKTATSAAVPVPTTPQNKAAAPPKADAAPAADIDKELERGIIFLANKQYLQAETAFKKVIKASPNHAIAHYNLAQTYMETGAFNDARSQAEKVLSIRPEYEPAQDLKKAITFIENQEKQKRLRKQLIRYLLPFALLIVSVFWAYKSGVFAGILPQTRPPALQIDTTLEDPANNNGYIDAGENVRLKVTISNQGGTAKGLKVRLLPKSIGGLNYQNPDRTLNIPQKGFQTLRIPISANKKVLTRRVPLEIQVFKQAANPLATTAVHLSIKAQR